MKTKRMWISAGIAFLVLGFYPVMGWIPVWYAYALFISGILNLSLSTETIFAFLVICVHCALSMGIGAVFAKVRLHVGVPAVLSLAALLFVGHQKTLSHDADFESSDGVWADGTVKFKGRDFEQVLWYFEAYRLAQQAEDVTLVRVTPTPRMRWLWSRTERNDPMWNVPYGESRGLRPYLGGPLSDEQKQEIARRRDEAMMHWLERSQQKAGGYRR